MNLTFDILTSKCGHESHVSWASLLPNFSFLCHAVLELGSDRQTAGRTDGQTDGHHCIMHTPCAGGGIQCRVGISDDGGQRVVVSETRVCTCAVDVAMW